MALVLKTDTNPGVARWEEEAAGGGFQEVTIVDGGASPDLEAEATHNIAFTGAGLTFNQPLPDPGASGRKGYRFVSLITGETTITLTYGGAGGVNGKATIIGPEDSALVLYDSDTDGWYVFPGAVQTP